MATIAALDPTDLAVDPGGQVTTTIRVRNTGSIVDRFDIDVVGITDWVRVDPPSLSLFPGAEESATITFAPPRSSMPRAGSYPFGVRVRPDTNPGDSVVEEGRISVTPFVALSAEIAPQTSRGSRSAQHQVIVSNRSNGPVDVAVTAVDPDRRLSIGVQPPRALVAPDERGGFGIRVEVDDPFPFGPARPRPFVATVETAGQAPIQLGAQLSQRAMLPDWLLRVGAGVAVAAVLVAGSFAFKVGPFQPAATEGPPPSEAVVTEPPPSEPPSEPPPSEAPPSEAPVSEPPTPTPAPPKPKDLALVATGDNGELGTGSTLSSDCGPDNLNKCRNEVKSDVVALIGGLQNQYTGSGITSAKFLAQQNALPLLVTSDREFKWQSATGDSGFAKAAVVDLGPLLADPPAFPYVMLIDSNEESRRFVADSSLANQIFEKLYTITEGMPTPAPLTPPTDVTTPIDAAPWDWTQPWIEGPPLIVYNP